MENTRCSPRIGHIDRMVLARRFENADESERRSPRVAIEKQKSVRPTASTRLKKQPGEGTGPTMHADLRGSLVGRVPPRGEPGVFNKLPDQPPTSMDAILTAILDDDRPRVKKLLKADPRLATCLIDAARLYESKIVHWIYVGDTALHLAAAGYRVELVRLLLAAGADPNSTMNHRQSGPLHYAADGYIKGPDWNAKRQVKTIQCLLDAGAEINAQDKNGAAPLHRAVRTRCAAAVKCLLKGGGDATLKNKSGSTPFHLAAQDTGHGGTGAEAARAAQRQIIQEFLSFGLNPALKDSKGKSVFDWAKSSWIRALVTHDAGTSPR